MKRPFLGALAIGFALPALTWAGPVQRQAKSLARMTVIQVLSRHFVPQSLEDARRDWLPEIRQVLAHESMRQWTHLARALSKADDLQAAHMIVYAVAHMRQAGYASDAFFVRNEGDSRLLLRPDTAGELENALDAGRDFTRSLW